MMLDALIPFDASPLATRALTILAGSTLKVTLLLIVAIGTVAALRGASAAARHLVWSVAVAATLAMPLLSAAVPDLAVPGLELRPGDAGPETIDGVVADLDATRDAAYAEVGIAEREWKEGLGLRADALEMRTGSLESRVAGLEERVAALEPLPGPIGPSPSGEGDASAGPAPMIAGSDAARALAAGGHAGAAGVEPPASEGSGTAAGPGLTASGPDLAATLVGVWAAGFLAVLGSLLIGMLRLGWIRRRTTRITSGPVAEAADRVASRIGLTRRPVLLQGDDTAMPMTWGLSRPVVLLPAGAEAWDPWRLDAVLLHELAHVKRRDYAAQVVADVACALYWFHPLVWIAAHRLRVEREHACDDVVVSAGTDGPAYAHGLLEIARTLRVGPAAARAALGMARPNHFRERLLAVLDQRRDRTPLTRGRAASAGGLGLALVLPLAALASAGGQAPPESAVEVSVQEASVREAGLQEAGVQDGGVQEATALCGPADGELERISHSTNDDRVQIETEYGRCEASVRIEGDIRFSDDLRSIAGLSGDGFLRLEVSREGDRRRLEVRPGSGGRPEYRWWIDGDERPFDPAAARWLEVALIDLFRTTGFKAEERVALILRQEGPEGVLVEVTRMRGDYPRAVYLRELLEQATLSPAQVRNVIEMGARGIDSDHWLARILKAAAEGRTFDAETRTAFIRAAGSLDSDHHQADVLGTALAREDLSREDLTALLEQVAAGVGSDHHAANLLIDLADRYPLEPALREPFLRAAATLDSDHHRANVYEALLARRDLRPAELATVLDAAGDIGSDHHLARVLLQVVERGLSDAAIQRAYVDAAARIDSDHHAARVLTALVDRDGVQPDELVLALRAAREIDSDHHLSQFLLSVASRHELEGEVREEFLRTLDAIESEHHHGRVASRMIRNGR